MLSIEEVSSMSILTLYRRIIKLAPFYPSKNRHEIMLTIKEQFRDSSTLTDPKMIAQQIKVAQMGLRNLDMYKRKSDELKHNYSLKNEGYVPSMNPKNDKFIYF